jgi:hypothetical protein
MVKLHTEKKNLKNDQIASFSNAERLGVMRLAKNTSLGQEIN